MKYEMNTANNQGGNNGGQSGQEVKKEEQDPNKERENSGDKK